MKLARLLIATLSFAAVLGCSPTPKFTGGARAQSSDSPPVICGRPCVISNSPGGGITDFRLEGFFLLHEKIPIIVDGPCFSACTLLLDVAHKNVCLTTRAILGFHQARLIDKDGKTTLFAMLNYETPGLNEYFISRGGLPASTDMLLVPYEDATKFFPSCPGVSP